MGLDHWAYSVDKEGLHKEIRTWRKQYQLHQFMEELWVIKGRPNPNPNDPKMFNCVKLKLNFDDIKSLKETMSTNFIDFSNSDFEFIKEAESALEKGYEIYYDSWW